MPECSPSALALDAAEPADRRREAQGVLDHAHQEQLVALHVGIELRFQFLLERRVAVDGANVDEGAATEHVLRRRYL
jgi:hypothetical protein